MHAEGIDPNRDFPYGRSKTRCMQTIAARALNELHREHLFQLALTFHGGMRAIGYEWGSPNHPNGRDESPGDAALRPLGQKMQQISSKSHSGTLIPYIIARVCWCLRHLC